jgi:hypothetical protein
MFVPLNAEDNKKMEAAFYNGTSEMTLESGPDRVYRVNLKEMWEINLKYQARKRRLLRRPCNVPTTATIPVSPTTTVQLKITYQQLGKHSLSSDQTKAYAPTRSKRGKNGFAAF